MLHFSYCWSPDQPFFCLGKSKFYEVVGQATNNNLVSLSLGSCPHEPTFLFFPSVYNLVTQLINFCFFVFNFCPVIRMLHFSYCWSPDQPFFCLGKSKFYEVVGQETNNNLVSLSLGSCPHEPIFLFFPSSCDLATRLINFCFLVLTLVRGDTNHGVVHRVYFFFASIPNIFLTSSICFFRASILLSCRERAASYFVFFSCRVLF
jgi:hypothetical protein